MSLRTCCASFRPEILPAGRSVWVTSPVIDRLRAVAETREEHLHLLRRRVLRLVEDDERVVQRAPAHERQRRHLDRAAVEHLPRAVEVDHVVRARRRADAGTDSPSRRDRRAGTRASRRPRPPGASGSMRVNSCFITRRNAHGHREIGLARTGRPDARRRCRGCGSSRCTPSASTLFGVITRFCAAM